MYCVCMCMCKKNEDKEREREKEVAKRVYSKKKGEKKGRNLEKKEQEKRS